MPDTNKHKVQRVIVNICTYKRPQLLNACLASIEQQQIPDGWDVEVLVVDNDKAEINSVALDQSLFSNKFKIHYIKECVIGIPHARNRALQESLLRQADWILFIDDDEEAKPGWLGAFHKAIAEFEADVYSGPVHYIFPSGYEWLANKGLSELARGSLMAAASTNNVLIKADLIRNSKNVPDFDTNMLYSGGSDTDFFMRLANSGARIAYVDDAFVSERVLENRLSLKWRLRRQFQSSVNRVYIEKKLYGQNRILVKSLKRALRHMFEGLLRLMVTPLQFICGYEKLKRSYYHGLRHFSKAFGTVSGLMDIKIDIYKGTDGY